jgi:dUTP pyrophosphatase
VFARSGLATKKGLAPANKVGVIDSDYRGEVLVSILNHGPEARTISPGERIAQLVVTPVVTCDFVVSESLSETVRGEGGFGSTGSN